jgi:hypothetical protein
MQRLKTQHTRHRRAKRRRQPIAEMRARAPKVPEQAKRVNRDALTSPAAKEKLLFAALVWGRDLQRIDVQSSIRGGIRRWNNAPRRGDLHSHRTFQAPEGASHDDLSPAQAWAHPRFSRWKHLAFQPLGDRGVGTRPRIGRRVSARAPRTQETLIGSRSTARNHVSRVYSRVGLSCRILRRSSAPNSGRSAVNFTVLGKRPSKCG